MCGCPSLWYTKCSSLPSTASSPQAPTPSAYSATSLRQAKKHASIGRARLRERGVPSSRSGTQRARTSRRSRRRPAGASTGEVRRVSREKPRRRTEEVARKRGGAAVLPRGTCGRSRPRGPQPRRVWRSSPWPPPSSSAAPRQSQLSPAVREPRLLVGEAKKRSRVAAVERPSRRRRRGKNSGQEGCKPTAVQPCLHTQTPIS